MGTRDPASTELIRIDDPLYKVEKGVVCNTQVSDLGKPTSVYKCHVKRIYFFKGNIFQSEPFQVAQANLNSFVLQAYFRFHFESRSRELEAAKRHLACRVEL